MDKVISPPKDRLRDQIWDRFIRKNSLLSLSSWSYLSCKNDTIALYCRLVFIYDDAVLIAYTFYFTFKKCTVNAALIFLEKCQWFCGTIHIQIHFNFMSFASTDFFKLQWQRDTFLICKEVTLSPNHIPTLANASHNQHSCYYTLLM
jgi:hypothetical protein